MNGENPFISVVVAAKDSQATIDKCLDSIFSLDYPKYEVILINDGSNDDTLRLSKNYSQLKIITTKGVGPSEARNIGIKSSSGEFIAFTDSDCIVAGDWLKELLSGFVFHNIAGVGGSQKSPSDETIFGRKLNTFLIALGFISEYTQNNKELIRTNHNPSCNVLYRKKALLQTGGFLKDLWPGEDVELDYRMRKNGYILMFNPAAIVFHYRVDNFPSYNNMVFRYGLAQGWLVRKYGLFRKIHVIPFLTMAMLIIPFLNFQLWLLLVGLLLIFTNIKILLKVGDYYFALKVFLATLIFWNLGFLGGLFKRNGIR